MTSEENMPQLSDKKERTDFFEPVPLMNTLFLAIIQKHPGITGYEIPKHIVEIIKLDIPIKSGSLYTQLRRLEKAKLVSSVQEPKGRRLRRYTITSLGEKELQLNRNRIEFRVEYILKPLIDYLKKIN
ncbi:MAG: PadR family transcriptional regulator [Promethearchaeota archaeon]